MCCIGSEQPIAKELVRTENAFLFYIGSKEFFTDAHGFLRCKSTSMRNAREASNTFTENLPSMCREIQKAHSPF